ncbi:MFS transporter [Streptomyces sp. NPDC057654]|uniref:MFS transporter n=1 Tax=Streptomyces sp. NPDC057654 TaxID=3346196 RepID=UPI00369053C7
MTSTRPGASAAPVAVAPAATSRLWRADFALLALGQAGSGAGSAVSSVALPLTAVLVLDASTGQAALLAACQQAPVLLVSLPVGALIDRIRIRPLLITTDLVAATTVLTVPVAAAAGQLTLGWLYAVATVLGATSVISNAATLALLPRLLGRERLLEATSRLVQLGGIAALGGSALAAGLVTVLGAALALLLDALSYVLSAVCTARIGGREPAPAPREGRSTVGREIWEGLRYVRRHHVIAPVLHANAVTQAVLAGQQAVLTVYLVRVLGWSGTAVGLALGAQAAGGLLGALYATRCVGQFGPARTMITALAAAPVSYLPLLLSEPGRAGQATVYAALLVQGVSAAVGGLAQRAVRMSVCAPRMHGRMQTAGQLVCAGPAPLAALTAGLGATQLGLRTTLAIGGCLLLLPVLRLLTSPLRHVHRLPDPDSDDPAPPRAVLP